jgi:hypothetical protein
MGVFVLKLWFIITMVLVVVWLCSGVLVGIVCGPKLKQERKRIEAISEPISP